MKYWMLLPLFAASVGAADWPQFRGPNRDDVSKETGLLQTWPEEGPPLVWSAKGIGSGYSSLSVAGDRIYTLGNKGNITNVHALDGESGKILWSTELGKSGGNLGCTPTVDGKYVYAIGQTGDIVCVEAATGNLVWRRNFVTDFHGTFGGWHYCESPLIDGDRLICTPGGTEATTVALNKLTGETVWKCAIPMKDKNGTQAGYSSIVIAQIGSVKLYVQLINGGLVGVRHDGEFLWKYEKLGPNTANIPTPIVRGDHVFGSAGYGKGGALLKLKADGDKVTADEVYFNRQLTNKHGGIVLVGDYLYGDSDDSGHPFCAEVKTGKVLWKKGREGAGEQSASVTYADGRLYFHYSNGVVALVKASPEGYTAASSFKVPKTQGPCWAHPVVAGGRLYLREGDMIYCYNVRAK